MTHKHCLRLNDKNEVIYAYSTGFEPYQEGDIILTETYERHFQFNIYTDDFLIKYRWVNGKLEEIDHLGTRAKKAILNELSSLDMVVRRLDEETLDRGKMHKKYLDVVARKEQLRVMLKEMGG